MMINKYDTVIVGGGLAGIVSAIELAEHGFKVGVLDRQNYRKTASFYAQGGIAAIVSEDDSIDLHVNDTNLAGGNVADLESVYKVVSNSPKAIEWLEQHGVVFDRTDDGGYSLHLEGGHSKHRILHIKDYTGKAILSSLYKTASENNNITVLNGYSAFELITNFNTCNGLYAYNHDTQQVDSFEANNIVLASGGASGIYKYVTSATAGIGGIMTMAYEDGCELQNLEFMQFHPTCFFCDDNRPLLISEAIRGSGAVLERYNGKKIMEDIHPQRDLAPRDIVARQIYLNMQKGHDIYLNATHLNASQWESAFPYIYHKLLKNNIDPSKDRIPISPAAHYSCGGIKVDGNSQTSIKNLYAVGEVSCTGLHGANRLASNSLLECIVYGLASSDDIILNNVNNLDIEKNISKTFIVIKNEIDFSRYTAQVRQIMWDYIGVVRNKKKLQKAKELLSIIKKETIQDYEQNLFDYEYDSFRKLLLLAELTVDSAIGCKNSIGSHYVDDNLA
ncbi:MAG: L-aspartate oxidase [Francisella sp.]|jgi:L-aspartate oxidase